MTDPPGDVTLLLNAWCSGDAAALERLAPLVESELRNIARAYMRRETRGGTLQPTALVNKAYVRLIGPAPSTFSIVSRSMPVRRLRPGARNAMGSADQP